MIEAPVTFQLTIESLYLQQMMSKMIDDYLDSGSFPRHHRPKL